MLVNFRNGGCSQSEVIGDETICFRSLLVKRLNHPQFSRIFLRGLIHNDLISDDALECCPRTSI